MEITNLVSDEYPELSPEERVSKLAGIFEDPTITGAVVRGEEFEGVITRKQLATSHHPPDQKLASLVWTVPRLAPDEDVRKVAQLMIESDSQLLPVFEGGQLIGVITVDGILEAVQPFLDAASVADAATTELVTIEPAASVAQALRLFREHRMTHLPVVQDARAEGILSLYDVTTLTVRSMARSQGGDSGGRDPFGGDISASGRRSRGGGFGAREGERSRMMDLPVRDVMVSPVRTIAPEETLEDAVEEMFAIDGSSLVVTDDGSPHGIVTKTDVLDALTWEAGGNRAVQIYGIDLVQDTSYDDIVAMIDKFDDRDQEMNVLDAKIHFHAHDERRRGTQLLLARIRLHTDRGLYIASGEGYGASQALNEARDVLERQLRDDKSSNRSKKPSSDEFWENRYSWLPEESA